MQIQTHIRAAMAPNYCTLRAAGDCSVGFNRTLHYLKTIIQSQDKFEHLRPSPFLFERSTHVPSGQHGLSPIRFAHTHKGDLFVLWVFADKTAIISWQPKGHDEVRYVPWPFVVVKTCDIDEEPYHLLDAYREPAIAMTSEDEGCLRFSFIPLLSPRDKHTGDAHARGMALTYRRRMKREIRDIVASFAGAEPLALSLDEMDEVLERKKALAWFATFDPDQEETLIEKTLSDIRVAAQSNDEDHLHYLTITGRTIQPDGILSDLLIKADSEEDELRDEKLKSRLTRLQQLADDLDGPFPIATQISQDLGQAMSLVTTTSQGPAPSAHDKIESEMRLAQIFGPNPD